MAGTVASDYQRAVVMAVEVIEQAIIKHGSAVTYEHIMAELAESATRELPAGTHYLRNAVDEADKSRAQYAVETSGSYPIRVGTVLMWACCLSIIGPPCKHEAS